MAKPRAIDAARLNSAIRSLVNAMPIEPFWRNPVACPVSASSVRSSPEVYFAISVSVRVARSCGTSPAACQVVPQVS